MRIFGRQYIGDERVYYVQNSWGKRWGGCWVAGTDGEWPKMQEGCCQVSSLVIREAWDIHVVEVEST
jgi:hypothetical protein